MLTNRRPLLRPAAGLLMAGLAAFALPATAQQTAPAQVAAQPSAKAPTDFVQGLGDKAIATLAQKKDPAQTKQVFRDLLNQNFDLTTIGRFVVGRYWNTATPEQQQQYMQLFERMIIDVYAERFSQYAGETFKVTGGQSTGERDTLVTSQVVRPNGPPVNVSWRVRNRDGAFKIVDVLVENVSMSQTQRSEFASVIENNGGRFDALLDALRQRTQTAQAR
ncbi:ABC transporter substrate-binding protein [Aerophototrophica crusticola]|uniref:ABC transporter substrate-binding protein n=1 Tax=Aerophototrophica crusticola TaxID=1709002 RepID=A0A858RC04_9PROT|nr:ABC transporter substrate-binding protein [Rhodospirillaceae bacterium B3]